MISLTNKIRIVAILAGFISMELEILGTRILSPIFGSTIYVWTSLIGITLTFLAIGYWFGGRLADKGKITVNTLGLIILSLGFYICLLPRISRLVFSFSGLSGLGGIKMKKMLWMISIALFVFVAPFSVMAGDFDGSKPLLFASIEVFEVLPRGCQEIEAENIILPAFFVINFEERKIIATPESGRKDITKIERMENIEGMLILQGAEDGFQGVDDGLGWTLAIEENTGKAVLSASWRGAALVIFGACTTR